MKVLKSDILEEDHGNKSIEVRKRIPAVATMPTMGMGSWAWGSVLTGVLGFSTDGGELRPVDSS